MGTIWKIYLIQFGIEQKNKGIDLVGFSLCEKGHTKLKWDQARKTPVQMDEIGGTVQTQDFYISVCACMCSCACVCVYMCLSVYVHIHAYIP